MAADMAEIELNDWVQFCARRCGCVNPEAYTKVRFMGHELSAAVRERRRDRILETATDVFLEHGYGGATMSLISQRLGGSKATLYAYFRNKEELCEAIVQRLCDRALIALDEAGAQPDLHGRLMYVGMAFMELLVSDQGVKTVQLAIEGSRTNRDLARRFELVGLRAVTEKLAGMLEEAAARGAISAPDPLEAANIFISLMRGDLHFRRLLNLVPEPGPALKRVEVARAIRVFLAAFSAAALKG
jgi:AcrR family transcriptional regulator